MIRKTSKMVSKAESWRFRLRHQWVLCSLVLTILCLCLLCSEIGLTESGSDRLMQQWASRKMRIKEEILKDLDRQGIHLPRNGSLQFEALIKPNPESEGEIRYELWQLEVTDQTESGSNDQSMLLGNATKPGGSGMISGTIHLKKPGFSEGPYKEGSIHIGPASEPEPNPTRHQQEEEK